MDFDLIKQNKICLICCIARIFLIRKCLLLQCFDKTFESKDSRNEEISVMYYVVNWHIFTWKIPNLSLIPHEADYAVQSPLFYFEGASWIIKMYLYGQTQYQTEGCIDFIIERLNSQTSRHDISCKLYCRNACNEEFGHRTFTFGFDSDWTYSRIHHFLLSPKTSELNDSWTLVFKFGTAVMHISEPDFLSNPVRSAIGKSTYKYLKQNLLSYIPVPTCGCKSR